MTCQPPVSVDGQSLSCAQVDAVARGASRVLLHEDGRSRAVRAHAVAKYVMTVRAVYGRTTGVGANRDQVVAHNDPGHGLRLLRSHASGAGPLHPPERIRALLLVRLNQLAAGGSGVAPQLLDALEAMLESGVVPAIHQLGAIGTGDLCALAELGLALCGELEGSVGSAPVVDLSSSDALALISSNAATIAEGVLAHQDLSVLLSAAEVVASLSFVALGGALQAYGAPVQQARAHPGQVRVAQRMRALLGSDPAPGPGRRLQDPFGLRAVPQVHGTAVDAVARLGEVLEVEMNSRAENPLIDVGTADAWHNANFHTGYLAHALDSARAAVYPVAQLSTARLGDLMEPEFSGLPAFLAEGPAGSSGVMALEYLAQDSVASLRHGAVPAALGTAIISRGLEDHASFSTHAARLATAAVPALRTVLACELVVAVRKLAMGEGLGTDHPLGMAYALAREVLQPGLLDRPLSRDVQAACGLLDRLGRQRGPASAGARSPGAG